MAHSEDPTLWFGCLWKIGVSRNYHLTLLQVYKHYNIFICMGMNWINTFNTVFWSKKSGCARFAWRWAWDVTQWNVCRLPSINKTYFRRKWAVKSTSRTIWRAHEINQTSAAKNDLSVFANVIFDSLIKLESLYLQYNNLKFTTQLSFNSGFIYIFTSLQNVGRCNCHTMILPIFQQLFLEV